MDDTQRIVLHSGPGGLQESAGQNRQRTLTLRSFAVRGPKGDPGGVSSINGQSGVVALPSLADYTALADRVTVLEALTVLDEEVF